jgi:hypothetical protein
MTAAFARFDARYDVTEREDGAMSWEEPRLLDVPGYAEFARRFAGCAFEGGLYRIHDAASGPRALSWVRDAFPGRAGTLYPFAFDWLGRQFAVDWARVENGEPLILLIEPGTGQLLEIPCTFTSFHDEELVDDPEAALLPSAFADWAETSPGALPIGFTQCVGYRKPLFLGGKDEIDNLEVVDIVVYWPLVAQLIAATAKLPDGTAVGRVTIE